MLVPCVLGYYVCLDELRGFRTYQLKASLTSIHQLSMLANFRYRTDYQSWCPASPGPGRCHVRRASRLRSEVWDLTGMAATKR